MANTFFEQIHLKEVSSLKLPFNRTDSSKREIVHNKQGDTIRALCTWNSKGGSKNSQGFVRILRNKIRILEWYESIYEFWTGEFCEILDKKTVLMCEFKKSFEKINTIVISKLFEET